MTNQWVPQDHVPPHIQKLLVPQNNTTINYVLAFVQIVRLLKTQKRTGWLDRKVPAARVESIADHMYRMSVLAMVVPREDVNVDKCVKIAVVHDIAEALVGDITPFGGVSVDEKHRREFETVKYLSALIEPYNAKFSRELVELWQDYEQIRCIEARYVKDIDKFEMIQQAWEYEQEYGLEYDLAEFYESRKSIKTAAVGELCDEVLRQRAEFIAQLKAAA